MKVTNLNDSGDGSLRDAIQTQPSPEAAMKRYHETLAQCADLEPPLTLEEQTHILDACLTGGAIILRCTVSTKSVR